MSKLEAGNELDALVAEKVMGWRLVPRSEILIAGYGHTSGPRVWVDSRRLPQVNENHFSPSSDIGSAWMVVSHWWQHRLDCGISDKPFVLEREYAQNPERWTCFFGSENWLGEATGITAPLAICRAALAAVGEPKGRKP